MMMLDMNNASMNHSGMSHSGMTHSDMDHSNMMHDMDMMDSCECPPGICETVDAQSSQLTQVNISSVLNSNLVFVPIIIEVQKDLSNSQSGIAYHSLDIHARQTSTPPLILNTILLI